MGPTEIALGFMLGVATYTDWREQRIYNKLLGPAFIIALSLQAYAQGWEGLKASLLGTFAGFLILLIPYLLGGIGAGDVKLLAVIGTFGGIHFVVISFLYGAMIGGLISAILVIRHKNLKLGLHQKFPYGIAIALGTFLAVLFPVQGGW